MKSKVLVVGLMTLSLVAVGQTEQTAKQGSTGKTKRGISSPMGGGADRATQTPSATPGREASSGMATGRTAGYDLKKGTKREASTGQATGEASMDVKSPRDSSSGMATGRSAGYDLKQAKGAREASTGQATGKTAQGSASGQAHVQPADLDGDGHADRVAKGDVNGDGTAKASAQGTVKSPRDASTGQASGKRDAATGQATGKRQHNPVTFQK